MNEEEQIAFIVHQLADGNDPKDFIYDLCEKAHLSWPQAEALVKRVQEEKEAEIGRKQFPLLFTLALGIFLVGMGLMGYSVYSFLRPLLAGQTGSPMDVSNYSIYLLGIVVESHGLVVYGFIIGLAMVLGSLWGMRDEWSRILTR